MSTNFSGNDFLQEVKVGFSKLGDKISQTIGEWSEAVNDGSVRVHTDIFEAQGLYQLHIELPGIAKETVSLQVHEHLLTIKGERKPDLEIAVEAYLLQERTFGAFSRSYELPGDVDTDTVKAKFDLGVLVVTFSKIAAA